MIMQLEKKLIEGGVIEKLKEKGWKYVEAKNLRRVGSDEPLLVEDLKKKILEINEDVELTEEDLKAVINKLQGIFTDQNGHKDILRCFKYGVSIKTEKERIVKDIQLFDYKNVNRNEFIFTNQIEFFGKDKIKLDLLLFVNGIPLVNIECKNPYTGKADYYDAYRQIKRYEKSVPELYKYVQIGIGFAERIKYFPIVPWVEDVNQEIWRHDNGKEEEAIFEVLKPDVLLDIIKNFLFIRQFKEKMTKVIGRYMQYRAANKIYKRVMENLEGKIDKNKGLIWHWQGSGKTLTMIFSAYKLYCELGKPTIFFVVDRKDLERQFGDELKALDLNLEIEKIDSIKKLKEVLTYDDNRGKRGVFLTLIHKFNLEESVILDEIQRAGEIGKRKDVICFLDEMHRSQYGILALKMKNILTNAFFFGFTGTPISYRERDTYREFGYIREGDPEHYLDRYFMDEAEKDGFVVPIIYELRREEVNLKDKDLEWYLQQVDVDDISDEIERREIKKSVEKKINKINVFLENRKNIEVICQDIAKHFKENFDGKFKGLIVTGSRKACVRFKEILDKYLEPHYSEVVMTFDKEEEEINRYREKLTEKYKKNDPEEIVKDIIEKFGMEDYPKLLIVTDMLITGFDEPKLAVLYLYKILKNHRLLQTIARVNRPYEQKPAGLIVDYVGIFKFLKQAFKAYSVDDAELIRERILSKKEAEREFNKILEKLENLFEDKSLIGNMESLDKAMEMIKNKGDEFASSYKELRKRFEFLKLEEKMLKVLPKYKWFSALYEYYKKLMKPDIDEAKIEKYFKRTIDLIHEAIEPAALKKIEPKAIDLEYIRQLKNSDLTPTQKYIGILIALKYICILKAKNPIYRSIADKVKELVKKWQEEGVEITKLISSIDQLINHIEQKKEEREETKLNELEFVVKLSLEKTLKIKPEEIEDLARGIYREIEELLYPGWSENPVASKAVERRIREFLSEIKPKYKIPYEEFDRLHKEIYESISGYEVEK
jgi:type I restriction enzyme R subunit